MWFNPACSKCRMTREMLDEAGAEYVIRDYLGQPPSEAELDAVLDKLGMQPWDIARMGEAVAAELDLANRPHDRADWLRVLAEHPVLIQRPILVTADGEAWITRDQDAVESVLRRAAT